jgi:hypothetical protein
MAAAPAAEADRKEASMDLDAIYVLTVCGCILICLVWLLWDVRK